MSNILITLSITLVVLVFFFLYFKRRIDRALSTLKSWILFETKYNIS